MAEVFISYKREERDKAESLHALLMDLAVEPWFDARLEVGADWKQRLQEQIELAKAMIICWSVEAIKSEYVRAEATEGYERGIAAPARIDAVDVSHIPFNAIQVADLSKWVGEYDHPELLKLLARLDALLGRKDLARNARMRAGGQKPVLVQILRNLLVDRAREGEPPLTYSEAEAELRKGATEQGLNVGEFDQNSLWGALDAITEQNRQRHEPPLAVQVVSASTGRPGRGYWQKHAFLAGSGDDLERAVFERHLGRVRTYTWPQDL